MKGEKKLEPFHHTFQMSPPATTHTDGRVIRNSDELLNLELVPGTWYTGATPNVDGCESVDRCESAESDGSDSDSNFGEGEHHRRRASGVLQARTHPHPAPSSEQSQFPFPVIIVPSALVEASIAPESSAVLPPGTPDETVVTPHGSGTGTNGVQVGAKRTSREQEEWRAQMKQKREECKLHSSKGAIVALTRTEEGYRLPSGKQLSCLPDAGYNAMKTLAFEEASLQMLRKLSIPELGNVREASWASFSKALITLKYPFKLVEVTSQFRVKGGLMLNLLTAPSGVYLVGLCVIVDGKQNKHCVMLSTIAEKHAPFGKLIDNHSAMKPVYLEEKDRHNKTSAKTAWKKFVGQNPAVHNASFTVDPADVYALVSI